MSWVILYFLSALLVAVLGRDRRPGFLGWLLMSLILTPLVGLAIFLVTQTTLIPPAKPAQRISLTGHSLRQGELCPCCHVRLAESLDVPVECPVCGTVKK